ncbi:hypothetical protein VTK73DRAFT_7133 [Phialemonium thermophilum]|uniref:Uncharacterized protein n=1 Tax=Phialemonium thermophilum TaxID=223376 RepID=A0ABR3WGI2_9PEZI
MEIQKNQDTKTWVGLPSFLAGCFRPAPSQGHDSWQCQTRRHLTRNKLACPYSCGHDVPPLPRLHAPFSWSSPQVFRYPCPHQPFFIATVRHATKETKLKPGSWGDDYNTHAQRELWESSILINWLSIS